MAAIAHESSVRRRRERIGKNILSPARAKKQTFWTSHIWRYAVSDARFGVFASWTIAMKLIFLLATASAHRLSPSIRSRPPLLSAVDQKKKELDADFLKIACPAFVQFAAEPLARLIDTAYLGRLGANALGGAGAAIAAQYSVSKLYNDPLLRTTISIVAAQEGAEPEERANAVSTALLLALVVGVIQGTAFFLLAGPVLRAMSVGPMSPMRSSALGYLRVCSLGAPSVTLWLAANGVFRGLGDTATPLLWALAFTCMNALLDPLFIFRFHMGAAGAAAGTAVAQTLALIPLLLALQRKQRAAWPEGGSIGLRSIPLVGLFAPTGGIKALMSSVLGYVQAGSFVLLRSMAKISAYSVCAREAARLGAVASAAHNLCFQLGVATTQLCESIAIATQTLLARELSIRPAEEEEESRVRGAARHVVSRGLLLGAIVSTSVSTVTLVNRRQVVAGLTIIPEVRAAAYAVMPLVLTCQVLKGLAYPVSGALMGALDWRASAGAMVLAQASTLLLVAVWSGGGKRVLALNELWAALAILFAVQIMGGLARIASGTGPWKRLKRLVSCDEDVCVEE